MAANIGSLQQQLFLANRSSVKYISPTLLLATGTNGSDLSTDGGNSWKNLDQRSFNSIATSSSGKAIYLAGSAGTIFRLKLAVQ